MHPATQKFKEQAESMLKDKGVEKTPEVDSMLQEKYDDVDRWMDAKPDWVDDEDIKPEIKKQ